MNKNLFEKQEERFLVLNEIARLTKRMFVNVRVMGFASIEDLYFSIEEGGDDYFNIEIFGEEFGDAFYTYGIKHYHKFTDIFNVGDTEDFNDLVNGFLELEVPEDCYSEEYGEYENVENIVKNIIEEDLEEIIYQNVACVNIANHYLNIA